MCFGITSLLNVMHGVLLVHMFVCKREPEVMAVLLEHTDAAGAYPLTCGYLLMLTARQH